MGCLTDEPMSYISMWQAEEGGEDDKMAPVQQSGSNQEPAVAKPATPAVKADESVAVQEKQQSSGSKKEEEGRRGLGGAVSRKEPAAEKAKEEEEDKEGYGEEEYEMDEGGEEEKAKDHKQGVTNSSQTPAPGATTASRQEEERAAASKVEPQGPTVVERAGSGAKLQSSVQVGTEDDFAVSRGGECSEADLP